MKNIIEFANFTRQKVNFEINDYVRVKKGDYSGKIGIILTTSTGGPFSTTTFGISFDDGELFVLFKPNEIQKLTPEEKDFLIDTGKYNL